MGEPIKPLYDAVVDAKRVLDQLRAQAKAIRDEADARAKALEIQGKTTYAARMQALCAALPEGKIYYTRDPDNPHIKRVGNEVHRVNLPYIGDAPGGDT